MLQKANNFEDRIASVNGIFIEFGLLLLLCIVGEKLKENVSLFFLRPRIFYDFFLQGLKVSDAITNSDILKIDVLLKKNAMLIIQLSIRPRKLSAMGFFTFELLSYASVSCHSHNDVI